MGPITPCGLAARYAVFIRVRTPNLTGTLRHPTGWLISNFLIVLTGGYYIPLSVSVTVEYPPQVELSYTPTLRTYC